MRRKLALGAALLTVLLLAPRCSPKAPANASGMNILLITLDTTRADALGLYGNTDAVSPRIDELGRAGIVFEDCYTPVPLTLPAHCSLFTGRYPVSHQVRNNGTYVLPASETTLAGVLKGRGYETAAIVASFTVAAKFGLARGFDTYDEDFETGRSLLNYTAEIPADRITGKFTDWLGARAPGRKFFAWVHFYDPHSPYVPHGEPGAAVSGESPWSLYEGEVRFVDAHVGKIVQALRDKGLYENTVIVLVGDHGEAFGEHKERGHGIFCYEESLRVPLVLHNPRLFKSPKRVAGRLSLVDVMPGLLELIKAPVPPAVQGRSFWAIADGKEKVRREIFFESLFGQEEFNGPLAGLIDGHNIYPFRTRAHDVDADPRETRNLLAGSEETARAVDKKLGEFVRQAAEAATGASRRELSASDVKKLTSLGYISSFSSKSAKATDPKRGIELYAEVGALKDLVAKGDFEEAEKGLAAVLARNPGLDLPDILDVRYQILKNGGRETEAWPSSAGDRAVPGAIVQVFLAMDLIESGRPARPGISAAPRQDASMTAAHPARRRGTPRQARRGSASYEGRRPSAQNGRWADRRLWVGRATARAQAILEGLGGRKAVVGSPEFSAAMSGLGLALLGAGEVDWALELYRKATVLSPESPAVWLNLGGAYFALGRYDEALESFEKAVALDKTFALGWSNIGQVHLMRLTGDNRQATADAALGYFDKAIALEPKLAVAWNGRASVALMTGQADRAIRDYERAIELDPGLLDAYINISVALRDQGRYAEALKHLAACKAKLYPRLAAGDREEIDRLIAEVKALKGGR
jgi:arylsulfatase A-like enzyme/Tfp pilus assembly protein PilF